MKRVALVSCVSKKLDKEVPAKDLYCSTLFKKNLKWIDSKSSGDISEVFILSALYGLVASDQIIKPYDKTLNNMSVKERREWAKNVIKDLETQFDLEQTEFVILAGSKYREFIVPELKHFVVPMQGLPIGKQLQWLTQNTED